MNIAFLGSHLKTTYGRLIAHQGDLKCIGTIFKTLYIELAFHIGHTATCQFPVSTRYTHSYKLQYFIVLLIQNLTTNNALCPHT